MSIPSELGHLAMPTNFLAKGKNHRWHKRVSNPGPLDLEPYALPLRHTGWVLQIMALLIFKVFVSRFVASIAVDV